MESLQLFKNIMDHNLREWSWWGDVGCSDRSSAESCPCAFIYEFFEAGWHVRIRMQVNKKSCYFGCKALPIEASRRSRINGLWVES